MQNLTPEYFEKNKSKYERKSVYSGFGWLLVTFVGISALPKRIEFYEKESGELAASFDDEKTRKEYIGRY